MTAAKRDTCESVTLSMCELFGGLVSSEESVRRALDEARLVGGSYEIGLPAAMDLALRAESAILFQVDAETVSRAAGSDTGPLLPDLPPLPFPQMIFEAQDFACWQLGAVEIVAVYLSEIRPGVEWIGQLFCRQISDSGAAVLTTGPDGFRLTPESFELLEVEHEALGPAAPVWRLIVEAVHFITAHGVSLVERNPDRAARRRAARGGYALPPRVYMVEVDDITLNVTSGKSDREYTCRWLVRGHWRRFQSGTKTWVSAYIKGPPGAPWRGRPIYKVAP